MFVACGILCLADVSSFNPSSEQTSSVCDSIRLCKNLLGLNQKASSVGVYAELGRMSLHVKIYSMILKFFDHLLEKSDNPLL